MASKKYAYYNKGNKLAIVEKNTSEAHCSLSGYSNKTECESAGGTWYTSGSFAGSSARYGKYLSPTHTVSDGLELEYSYVPTWILNTSSALQTNKFYVNGWTVIDGYLAFVRANSTSGGPADWTSAPYNSVGVDEYISIEGSDRWDGIHQIKARANTGILTTYTKVNSNLTTVIGSSNINIAAESGGKAAITANNSSNIFFSQLFSAGDYVFISGAAAAKNNIMWEVHSVEFDDGVGEEDSKMFVANSYRSADNVSYGNLNSEVIDTTVDTTAQSSGSITVYKVVRDFFTIQSDITIMEDETFHIDLNRYQGNALVYYLKAKNAEDMMDNEQREYFMRLFRKQVEKFSNSRKRGPNITQGHWSMHKIF